MTGKCVACGGEVGDAAARCASCGLVFVPAREGSFVPPPAAVEATGVESEEVSEVETPDAPRRLEDPRVVRRRRIVASLVAAVVIAGIVVVVRHHRPNTSWTWQENLYARYETSAQFAPVPLPEAGDDSGYDPADVRAAEALAAPLPDPHGLTVHQYFDAFLDRVRAIYPDRAGRFDGASARRCVRGEDPATRIAWRRLCRDAERALRNWPDAGSLSPHDRADVASLLGWAETSARWRPTDDIELLQMMTGWFDALVTLQLACADPEPVRLEAATARLTEIPDHLWRAVGDLKDPPRCVVAATADRLDDAAAYLATYAGSWPGAAGDARARLEKAAAAARTAATGCASTLRAGVTKRARGDPALGPANVALLLRARHCLDADARSIYERAEDALRDAHDDMRSRFSTARETTGAEQAPIVEDEQWIRRLRQRVADWVVDPPAETAVRVLPVPVLWAHRKSQAYYLDAGAADGVVFVDKPRDNADSFDAAYHEAKRQRALAHETYPGHRLEALFRHDVCDLRQFVDDRVFIEGWGVYAEDLASNSGVLPQGPMARYVEASTRAERARHTMIVLAIATGAADEREALGLLLRSGWPKATFADVGVWASSSCYEVNYSVGAEEIRALRREEEERLGSAFDLRAFHTRLLKEGPIPVPLIRTEWREEREGRH